MHINKREENWEEDSGDINESYMTSFFFSPTDKALVLMSKSPFDRTYFCKGYEVVRRAKDY